MELPIAFRRHKKCKVGHRSESLPFRLPNRLVPCKGELEKIFAMLLSKT